MNNKINCFFKDLAASFLLQLLSIAFFYGSYFFYQHQSSSAFDVAVFLFLVGCFLEICVIGGLLSAASIFTNDKDDNEI